MSVRNNRLYVGNIGFKVTEGDIRSVFIDFGPIRDVYAPPSKDDPPSGNTHRGFMFVEFEQDSSASHALQLLNGTSDPSGRKMVIRPASAKPI